MNLLAQLNQVSTSIEKKQKINCYMPAAGKTLRAKTEARWKELFEGKPASTPELAKRIGHSGISTLNYLYILEKRGCVARVGLEQSTGSRKMIIWEWVK